MEAPEPTTSPHLLRHLSVPPSNSWTLLMIQRTWDICLTQKLTLLKPTSCKPHSHCQGRHPATQSTAALQPVGAYHRLSFPLLILNVLIYGDNAQRTSLNVGSARRDSSLFSGQRFAYSYVYSIYSLFIHLCSSWARLRTLNLLQIVRRGRAGLPQTPRVYTTHMAMLSITSKFLIPQRSNGSGLMPTTSSS
jgi:hypothetical protein